MDIKNAWIKYKGNEREKVMNFAEGYKKVSVCLQDRERMRRQNHRGGQGAGISGSGGSDPQGGISRKSGDKVYANNMGKALALFQIGKKPLEDGMRILGAHIDSPRLDLKQNPLYEEGEQALWETHYYGGVKKYQWVTLPMAVHGVVVKKDGTRIALNIGEGDEDPVVGIRICLFISPESSLRKREMR